MKEFLKKIKRKAESKMPDRYFYWRSLLYLLPDYCIAVFDKDFVNMPKICFYSDRQTVDMIVNDRMSLARYGDGEFAWMSGKSLDSYQDYSDKFAEDLRTAFYTSNPKVLTGIPIGIFDSSKCNVRAKIWWRIIREHSKEYVFPLINENQCYANASISRPYIDYRSRKFSACAFKNLKRIWEGRDVCFVEGNQTRLGMGNDLFSNARTISRIICPAKNAYSRIDEIQRTILEKVDKDTLIIAALGPTASILAVRMAELGYQFVDLGHVDVEYVWYLNKSVLRDAIPGKYVNESSQKFSEDIYADDKEYLDSIIAEVK